MSVDISSAAATTGVDPSRMRVAGAIKQGANLTGTSFEYLLTTAKMESDFDPSAGATTSSARGLFQFIDQTWLGTVKEAGPQLGYGNYADAITRTASGSYTVDDPATRGSILKLRDDPTVASAMAGALTQSNSFKLSGMIGRRPNDAELYMAHLMGVGGAAKLIGNAEDNPQAVAARLFPNAAAANRPIFYDGSGRARSVSEVYSVLSTRYAGAANSKTTRTAMAVYGGTSAVASAAGASAIDNAAYLSSFPDARAVQPKANAFAATETGAPSSSDPVFHSLFQGSERGQPVSSTVQALWGNTSAAPQLASGTPSVRAPQPLDLFSDRAGSFSS